MFPIPLVAGTPLDLLAGHLRTAGILLDLGRRKYGAAGVLAADRLSRRWLRHSGNPYLAELDAMAGTMGEAGVHMLNLSYEWGCTTAVAPAPDGRGCRMLRTLDWRFEGLGRHVAVLRSPGEAGDYFSITWPGFCGVLTAMAPGRFSVAINQAKRHHGSLSAAAEWPLDRLRLFCSTALPPAHLLRRVCEQARDYAEAVEMLCRTPVCLPAFFTVGGVAPDEACVIERLPRAFHLHPGPTAQANHFRYPGLLGRAPGWAARLDGLCAYIAFSRRREQAMAARMGTSPDDLSWLTPPVLAPETRIAVVANAATGLLLVQGIEGGRPATERLKLHADISVAAHLG